ncbi:LytTR family DNA-binding domain-containing protein [Sphingorhabdus sp. Alg239-R122]|uniref:LytR/AlgR family response regulator transcription factor n=1 Tax=Sphingorhabdus sp. Alg239-R122 TaxID=2305989 RepID=UPI0013D8E7F2|nr:LytTR family DNA-binding domain-containing protein [Sphingorhabdus sp. Alg239-R122]
MTTPLRTLIVDDEPLAVERLQLICARLEQLNLIGTATDGQSALRMTEELSPDLLLLDITMPKLDGMGVARTLAKAGSTSMPAIIFVTAHEEFAVEAFDLAVIDYVLKPVAKDRLTRAVDRVLERRQESTADDDTSQTEAESEWAEEFWVPHKSELKRIATDQIDRIEAERDYMRLHVGSRSYLMHQTIKALEARLDPGQFIRLHRSHIVRIDRIAGLKHEGGGIWHARLNDESEIRIGRTFLSKAKKIAGR